MEFEDKKAKEPPCSFPQEVFLDLHKWYNHLASIRTWNPLCNSVCDTIYNILVRVSEETNEADNLFETKDEETVGTTFYKFSKDRSTTIPTSGNPR